MFVYFNWIIVFEFYFQSLTSLVYFFRFIISNLKFNYRIQTLSNHNFQFNFNYRFLFTLITLFNSKALKSNSKDPKDFIMLINLIHHFALIPSFNPSFTKSYFLTLLPNF